MTSHPFLADPPEVISLSTKAPLERVIAQVQFPPIHLGEKKSLAVAFHDLVSAEFPYASETHMLKFEWSPEGGEPKQEKSANISHRFHSANKQWELSLGNDFISLVCTRYDTREEFQRLFLLAIQAAAECLKIKMWGRLGLRYVNRNPQTGPEGLDHYRRMLKPEFRGISGSPIAEKMTNCLFSAEWNLGDELFAAVRHGCLAPGITYEPFSVPPRNEEGWVLDIDVFLHPERFGNTGTFTPENLGAKYTQLADREYSIFRELVSPEFIEAYRGDQK